MGLRVLERNLTFSERKLEGRLWQEKARLDAAFAKPINGYEPDTRELVGGSFSRLGVAFEECLTPGTRP